jgi:hypothetical protein
MLANGFFPGGLMPAMPLDALGTFGFIIEVIPGGWMPNPPFTKDCKGAARF